MGTTPPPSPSDKMDHVALNARIVQLSSEVDRLKKVLSKTETKRVQEITVEPLYYIHFDTSNIYSSLYIDQIQNLLLFSIFFYPEFI